MVGPPAAAFMEHLCIFASSYIGNSSWECLTKGLLKSLDPGLVPAFQGWPEVATCIYTEGKCPALRKQGGNLLLLNHKVPVIQYFVVCARFATKFS